MIIEGRAPGTSEPVSILLEDGAVSRIVSRREGLPRDFGGPDLYLFAGFFDPQVNGYAGVDFNGKGLTPERFHHAARFLALSGVTRFLPTLLTASQGRMESQLRILANAFETDPLVRRMCPGIHLEGPYISPEDGPRGVHPRDSVRLPQWEEVKRFQEASGGRIKIITLAPEMEGAIPLIERAVASGMVVGLGHTNADEEILEDAVRAGALISCHLGNATRVHLGRHRNSVQKQLSLDQLMASLIADGVHLPGYVVKNFVRGKGIDRVLLTTDCVAGAGAPPGRYTLGDLEVEVGRDRIARLAGTPYLAGSCLTMDQAVNNVIRFAAVDMASAIQMASKNGERLFPEIRGEIIPGHSADVVLFEYKDELVVKSTWIGGEMINPKAST